MRRIKLIFALFITLFSFHRVSAGHGMALVNPSFTVGATALTFTASSNAATCGGGPYWLQVELRCTAGQLTGTPPATMQTNLLNWTGPGVTYSNFPWYNALLNVPNYTLGNFWPDNCTTEPYHPVNIPFTGLCPGQTYFFSAREWVSGTNTVGPWTTPSSFVVPGVFVPLNFNVVATPSIFCAPGSSTLNVNSITGGCGQTSTLWSPGGSTLNTIVVSPAATTTYTALVSTPCNTLTKVVTVSVVPNVSAAFTPVNSATCTGSTVQFNHTGTAGVSHTWSAAPAAGVTINTVNSASPSITFANPGNYVISHTVSAGSCTNVVTTNITVSGVAVTFSTPNYTQCLQGNSFTFSSSSAVGTHTYAFNPTVGAPPTGSTGTYGPVSFTAPGTYTVTYSNNNGGCTATSSSVVVINPQPTVTANNNGPICTTNTASLTGTGGGTYNWSGPGGFTSALQNPTIPNVALANAGVYSLTVTLNGCVGTATTNLAISTTTAAANNTGPYCAGATIQLNGTAGTSYTWTGPGGFTSNLQNPTIVNSTTAMSGTYSLVVNTGGCIATATTSVTVNASPTPNASNTGPYCAGSTIQLNVGAFTTYTWSGPSAFTSNGQNPTVTNAQVTNGGVYTVSVTDPSGCIGSSTTNVVINPSPNPIAGSNNPVCLGNAINLTSNGGGTYSWSGPNGFTSALQNPVIGSSTALNAGVYSVTVTNLGCIGTSSVNVSVISPTASAANTGPYCAGSTIQLSTSGALTYTWTGPGGYTANTQNPTIAASTTAMSGVYNVTLSAGTCTATASTTIVVNPLPLPTISANDPICEGVSLNLSGTGGVTYSWTGPNGFVSNSQNPSILVSSVNNSGNYVLTVTDANGCTNTTNTIVTINALPTPGATGGAACENNNIQLNANGGSTYSWSGPNGFTSNLQNPVIANAPFAASGQYTVVVTTAAGCSGTTFVNVNVTAAPSVQINVNGPICENNNLSFTANGGSTYQWSGPNGFVSSQQNPAITGANSNMSGIYTVIVTDANGCSTTATVNAVVNPNPTGTILSGNVKGCTPVCATFSLSSNPVVASADWNLGDGNSENGVTSINHCYTSTGVYTLTALFTDLNGCNGYATSTVEVVPSPVADFNFAPLKPIINQDQIVTFTDASHGGNIVSWNWFFMSNASATSNMQNPTYMYTEPGTYAVALVVKNDIGCTDTLIRPIVVGEDFGIYVPNAFTPNNDGINDIFQPKGFGIVDYELQIFDRWGEKIFGTKTFEEGWNGTRQSKNDVKYGILMDGTYTWLINVKDVFGKAHELKGHVTLIK